MIAVDYIILAIIIVSAAMGLVRGLLREAIAVITWFLAIVLSWSFAPSLEPHLGGVLVDSPLRIWAARAIIFVGVLLLGGAISVIVTHYVRVSMFAGMDKFLGLVFGIIRGVVVVGAALACVSRLTPRNSTMTASPTAAPVSTAPAQPVSERRPCVAGSCVA